MIPSENKKSAPSYVEKALLSSDSQKKNNTPEDFLKGSLESNDSSKEMSSEDIERLLASEAFGAFVKEKGLKEFMGLNQELKASYDALTKNAQSIAPLKAEIPANTSEVKNKLKEGSAQQAIPLWAAQMKEKLDRLEKEKEQEAKKQNALSMLEASGLPKALQRRWAARIDLDKEDIKNQISALEGEFSEIQKSLMKGSRSSLPLGALSKGDKPDKEEIENIIARL